MLHNNLPEINSTNFGIINKLLTGFIKEEILRAGLNKVVLGLSGGVDSAVVSYLAASALGNKNVTAVLMPYKTSSPKSLEDGLKVVGALRIKHFVIDISRQIDDYFAKDAGGDSDGAGAGENGLKVRIGNKMARERMSILYDLSYKLGSLVLGTSNKSELLLGYGTIYGDMASAVNPIGDIYKTQIHQLAGFLNIPKLIVKKAPSADLWIDQTDEKELGFTYKEADNIMFLLVDKMYKPETVSSLGYDENLVSLIYGKIKRSQYKRRMPLIAKVSQRTINIDFRYLRDWA